MGVYVRVGQKLKLFEGLKCLKCNKVDGYFNWMIFTKSLHRKWLDMTISCHFHPFLNWLFRVPGMHGMNHRIFQGRTAMFRSETVRPIFFSSFDTNQTAPK